MIKLLHLLKEVLEGSNKAPQGVIDFSKVGTLLFSDGFENKVARYTYFSSLGISISLSHEPLYLALASINALNTSDDMLY